jgi:hypothetical protein
MRRALCCAAMALVLGWAAPSAAQQYSSSRSEMNGFFTPEVNFTTMNEGRATLIGFSAGTIQGDRLMFGLALHHLPFSSPRGLTYGGVIFGGIFGGERRVILNPKALVGFGRVAEKHPTNPFLDYSDGLETLIIEPKMEFLIRNPQKDRFRLMVGVGYRWGNRNNFFEPSASGPTVSMGVQFYFNRNP